MEKYITLIFFVLVMTITPGPNNIILTVSGSKFGFKRSLAFVLGIVIGLNSQLILFSLGLGVIFTKYPGIQNILKIPGTIYILYLAYKIGFNKKESEENKQIEKPFSVLKGFIFQYLNPKAYLMTLASATIYSESGENYVYSIVIILATYTIIAPLSTSLWAAFGTIIKKFTYGKNREVINKSLGLVTALSVIFIIK